MVEYYTECWFDFDTSTGVTVSIRYFVDGSGAYRSSIKKDEVATDGTWYKVYQTWYFIPADDVSDFEYLVESYSDLDSEF